MDFMEEEILEEPIQVPLESLLYMVPDAQDNPNTNIAAIDSVMAMEGATCIVQEELPMTDHLDGPPLLNPVVDCDQSQPSLFRPENLEIIFEMIGYMMEQLHQKTLISSRIDMLYDTFSNGPVKKRFSTCTQPFALTPSDDTPYRISLDGRFHCPHIPPNV
jgi:hypothetical protein